ncbi:MAG: glycoside hydrolase family 127 protein, partial [Bacteroidales bacterium]|nr:glycoside hydrolase family 127 protein [Bacteroidales bacterium]
IVYCAEEIDNSQLSKIYIADSTTFNIERKSVLSEKVNSITTNCFGKELTLIPYYLWSNRGTGEMKVWFNREKE